MSCLVRMYPLGCRRAAPTHTCQQSIRQYTPRSAICAARPPRTVWLEECYVWHTYTRYYKRTLWHSLTTACIATDANSVSSVSPRPNAHDHDSSKSTSLTVCVQPPVNSFRAIVHVVQQSHEISRARARERERRCCRFTNVVESCCVAQHRNQAVVYHCFLAQLASQCSIRLPAAVAWSCVMWPRV